MNSPEITGKKPSKLLYYSFASALLVAMVSGAQYIYPIFGTSLVYQFHWTSLENSVASTATFIGSVVSAPLCALLVEKLKARRTLIIASLSSTLSLLLLYITYSGYLSTNVILCSIYLAIVGFAGGAANLCALDSQAHNFKSHKGITMGITSAAFGVSGLVFAQINDHFFQSEEDNTSEFLIFYGSFFFLVTISASFILGPINQQQYEHEDHNKFIQHATQDTYTHSISSLSTSSTQFDDEDDNDEERKPLLSRNMIPSGDNITLLKQNHPSKQMSCAAFFTDPVGYSLVISLMVVTGLGYVYFANLGQLLLSVLPNATLSEAQHLHNYHVALFSSINCGARIGFGALSDLLKRKAGVHRLWFLWAASVGLLVTLVYITTAVTTAEEFIPCTIVIATLYGINFGLAPALVSEFDEKTFARNLGWLMWSPAVGSQLFNILFGVIYGRESKRQGDSGTCSGSLCYEFTFLIGSILAFICVILLSLTIYKKRLYKGH